MNALTQIVAPLTLDDAHMLRSRLIERSAAFETKLHRVAAAADAAISMKAPLGQKIDALQTAIQAKSKLEKHDKRIVDILEKAMPLMALRNELAHGTMQIAIVEGEAVLLICNAARATEAVDLRCLVRKQQLTDAAQSFAGLANRLGQILIPPSPRQPGPGAAAGP